MRCVQCLVAINPKFVKDPNIVASEYCVACWYRPFQVTSVCRADLVEVLALKQIAQFTDADMKRLAEKMAAAYTGSGMFWIDLGIVAKGVLGE